MSKSPSADAAKEALEYHPSKVEWATAQFLDVPPSFIARLFFYLLILSLITGLAYTALAKVAVTVSAPGALAMKCRCPGRIDARPSARNISPTGPSVGTG